QTTPHREPHRARQVQRERRPPPPANAPGQAAPRSSDQSSLADAQGTANESLVNTPDAMSPDDQTTSHSFTARPSSSGSPGEALLPVQESQPAVAAQVSPPTSNLTAAGMVLPMEAVTTTDLP